MRWCNDFVKQRQHEKTNAGNTKVTRITYSVLLDAYYPTFDGNKSG